MGMSTSDAEQALFDALSDLTAGMLGIEGSTQHSQPMSHMADRDARVLWFITSLKTDLVKAVGTGARAHFTITGKDHDLWAAISGPIKQSEDRAKLEDLWSPFAAAWFDGGRADPDVCLLRLDMASASVWTASANPLVFGLEIARANLDDEKKPDIGDHVVIDWT